ncbi:MAG: glycosyltransferase family 4 protein, partial [Pirellulaceae bacterium]|nr:glycosyltransferase family 4 protein [Pirellulaceae bacterium]
PALLARSNQLPKVVLRFDTLEGIGPLSDRLRQRTFSACKQAAKVIVPHEHARRELIAAGVTPQRIDLIPDGPFPKFQRDGQTRASARRSLADINYDLHLRSDDRLCVCFTDPIKNVEVELVVRTLAPILEARRGMRLWLVGDLPERRRFHELISRGGWKQEVLLVGNFEDPDTVLMASDLCIVPSSTQGLACIMPTAIQSGLPTLACDCPAVRSRFGEHCQPLCFEPGNAEQLHQRVVQWCDHPNVFQEPVARVSQLLLQQTAGAQMYL